jgi:deferrochelatase/peroxidase EfeB
MTRLGNGYTYSNGDITMATSVIDYNDVQGLVRFGYGHLPEACFLLLQVENAAAACSWLATVSLTTAESLADRPQTVLQIAFTCAGLRALGISEEIIQGFSHEFITGMTGEVSRSCRLGDVGVNAPAQWTWGSPGSVPHMLLMLYAPKGQLEAWKTTVSRTLPAAGLQLLQCLDTTTLDDYEPFGFKDGISQPQLDWLLERRASRADQLEYSNLVALGEFLLGYPNEYGQYTDRPCVDFRDDPHNTLLPAEDQPQRKDLGRNGTYLVLRQLQQDVQGFWQFLDQQAHGNPTERQKLAEAMVGRTMEGTPLVPMTEHPICGIGPKAEEIQLNQFTYTLDNAGTHCPFGAHIRRANPRNADLPEGTQGLVNRLVRILGFGRKSIRDDTIASTRFHRLLRRGRKYGKTLLPEDALQRGKSDGEERGLYFICLNANIGRQFEFVQNAWFMSTKFNGLSEEQDPLLGSCVSLAGCSPVPNMFSLPQLHGVRRRITGMPQFVTVRGGAYFFLPSIRVVRYLASLRR